MRKGLGKGLEALLGDTSPVGSAESEVLKGIDMIKITDIEPNINQPRKRFDEEGLRELTESIRKHGIVQPIIVRRDNNKTFKIIAGERRWRAAKSAGLKELPVLVKDATDRQIMEIALIENLQREDLNAIEEANAYRQLISEYSMTHGDIAEIIGKSRVDITNKLRLLKLPPKVLEMIENSEISAGHARALLSLDTDTEIEALAGAVAGKQLSVRQTETQVKRIKSKEAGEKKKNIDIAEAIDLQNRLTKFFEAKVRIVTRKKGSKIVIDCPDDEALNTIIEKLGV
jgi:ParB family transcriptional regulator, chromosome partitioning protein